MGSFARALRQPDHVDGDQVETLLGVGFALSPLAAVLLDDELIIIAANRAAELTFGSGTTSLLCRRLTDLAGSARSADFTRQAAALGSADHLGQELELVSTNGDRVIAMVSADAVFTPSGRRYVLVHLRDVTALRNVQQELAASGRRYRQLANSLPDASVIFFDRELRVQSAFGEAIRVNGHNPLP